MNVQQNARSRMEKFIIIAILMISGDKLLTWAVPSWTSDTATIDVSMIDGALSSTDGSSTCTDGVRAVASSTESITYSTINIYGFTVSLSDSYVNTLYCDFTTLQALDSSVNTFDVVVSATTDTSGSSNKTFTIRLIDLFAPVFAQNPITITITICQLSAGNFANDDEVHSIDVTDADPDDAVTVQITTSGTPFGMETGTLIVLLKDTDALLQLLNNTNTPNPYTFDIQADDIDNKHQTDGQVQISYTSGENCDDADAGADAGANGDGDDDDGFNVLSYNLYVVGLLILIIRLIHKLE